MPTPSPKPSVVVIGSFRRNYDHAKAIAHRFIDLGIDVLTPPIGHIVNPGADYVRFEGDPDSSVPDSEIQDEVMERIFAADCVYVSAPKGYIGLTTCYELGQVEERGRQQIFFSSRPQSPPYFPYAVVATPAAVAAWLKHSTRSVLRCPTRLSPATTRG